MTLTIPDDILKAAKMDEQSVRVEFACHLFDKGLLTLGQAMRLTGLTRTALEDELFVRHIPVYRYDVDDFQLDLEALAKSLPREK